MTTRMNRRRFVGKRRFEKPEAYTRLYISGFNDDVNAERLAHFFEENFGEVNRVDVLPPKKTTFGKKYGFVTFKSHEIAKKVMDLGYKKEIYCDFACEPDRGLIAAISVIKGNENKRKASGDTSMERDDTRDSEIDMDTDTHIMRMPESNSEESITFTEERGDVGMSEGSPNSDNSSIISSSFSERTDSLKALSDYKRKRQAVMEEKKVLLKRLKELDEKEQLILRLTRLEKSLLEMSDGKEYDYDLAESKRKRPKTEQLIEQPFALPDIDNEFADPLPPPPLPKLTQSKSFSL